MGLVMVEDGKDDRWTVDGHWRTVWDGTVTFKKRKNF